MPMHEMFRISNQGCQLRDLVSTFCSRSPCLPRAAPSLMIPTDYGANIESWEGQHRHKETQGRPTWTHRRPTQTQAYKVPKRNTGKEIQTKGRRHKCWICFRVISIFFPMHTISVKIFLLSSSEIVLGQVLCIVQKQVLEIVHRQVSRCQIVNFSGRILSSACPASRVPR